jgi:hypothetical protein
MSSIARSGKAVTPNPSLERTAPGKPLGPRAGQCHHPSRGPSAFPAPALSAQTLGVMQVTLRISTFVLALCSQANLALAQSQASEVAAGPAPMKDLRAAKWRKTQLENTSAGAVQHGGDDLFGPGGVALYLMERLSNSLPADEQPQLKTADIRLFVPGTRIDPTQLSTVQALVPAGALVAGPIASLISRFSKNKSASAVFCISIAGKDYLGNDARLFRVGPESELRESIAAAAAVLAKNVASGTTTDSPACSPGWEGGQPQPE